MWRPINAFLLLCPRKRGASFRRRPFYQIQLIPCPHITSTNLWNPERHLTACRVVSSVCILRLCKREADGIFLCRREAPQHGWTNLAKSGHCILWFMFLIYITVLFSFYVVLLRYAIVVTKRESCTHFGDNFLMEFGLPGYANNFLES